GRGALDAVRTWVLGVHRRVVDRLPGRIALGGRVAVDVTVADCGDRSPELVVIFGVEERHGAVGLRHRVERHEPRAVDHAQLLEHNKLAGQRLVGWRPEHQPESGGLGLPRRTLGAGLTAIVLDLVVIGSPLLALERDRRTRPELRRLLEYE